jgi:DNA-binding transcriptional MerR regulator
MKKLYYSMGEVSKLTGLAPHVLRSWEKNYSELNPKKNSAGNRAYKDNEVELIFKIKELLEDKKYTSAGVKKVLKKDNDPDTLPSVEIPSDVRKDLNEVKIFLNNLLEKL